MEKPDSSFSQDNLLLKLIANGILKSEVLMVQFIQKNKCEKYEQYE
jgi:hypothetical protein